MKTVIYLCLGVSGLLAQTASLEGDLVSSTATDMSHLKVRLGTFGRETGEEALVSMGGGFRFSNIAPGKYLLTVTDETGSEITRDQVDVLTVNPPLKVELPEVPAARKPAGPVSVSVAQLRHKPDRQAVREWRAAIRRSESGDFAGAAKLLEQAVARDPQFAEAHANLGAQYVRLHQSERAAAEFRTAVAIDSSNAAYQSNLALALAAGGQREEAALWARHALQIDSTNALGHYVLGCVLADEASTRAEGVRHLQLAAATLPSAQKTLDAILALGGHGG